MQSSDPTPLASSPAVASETHPEFRVTESYRRYVVWLLFLVFVLNFVDRQILTILIQPIKQEFDFSDTQLGMLGGLAFAFLYSTLGIPIARFADRSNRVMIISVSLAVWSVFTALTGLARNFTHFLVARIAVGIGEAGCTPAAHSIIADYFEPKRRASAIAIYSMGIYGGVFVGFVVGGIVAQHYGWRAAFFVVGLPGVLVALLLRFTLREPPRGFSDGARIHREPPPVSEVIRSLWNTPSFKHTALAAALHAFVGYGVGGFYPAFLMRTQSLGIAEAGIWLALTTAIGGFAGTYYGGVLADRLTARDGDQRHQLWVPGWSTLASVPIGLLVYLLPQKYAVLILMIPGIAIGAMYLGPTAAITQGMVGVRERATASALMLLVINLIGLGLGPLLTGALSDLFKARFVAGGMAELKATGEGLRWSLIVMGVVNVWSWLHYMLAARTLREDLERARTHL